MYCQIPISISEQSPSSTCCDILINNLYLHLLHLALFPHMLYSRDPTCVIIQVSNILHPLLFAQVSYALPDTNSHNWTDSIQYV